jgi:hypothetical protein
MFRKMALNYQPVADPEKSPAWVKEFARKVRARVLWLDRHE